MKYDKPEVVLLGSAVNAVRSASATKTGSNHFDGSSPYATSTAYEADE